MTEQRLDLVQSDAGLEQIAGVAVAQVVIAHPPELRGIDHRKKIPTEVARIQVGKLAFSLLFSLPAPSPCEVRRGVFGIELGSYVCLSKLMSLKKR